MNQALLVAFCSFFFQTAVDQTSCVQAVRACQRKYEKHGYCMEVRGRVFEIRYRKVK